MKKIFALTSFLIVLFVSGCASNPMQLSSSQTLSPPNQNTSQVVFLRSSFVGSLISASLYDVTDNKTEFLGIIANDTKIAVNTTPGKHTFMVVSEAADFMEAELLPGKTYYSIVTPRLGTWSARFSLWPIRNDGTTEFNTSRQEFKDWTQKTKLAVNSDKSIRWFENSKNSVIKKQQEYWPVWKQKNASDLAERTLNPKDGL